MPIFRVRPGYRHGAGKPYGPGDLVTLSDAEAAGFLDKLERVEDAPPAPAAEEEAVATEEAATEPDAAEDESETVEPETDEAEGGDADESAPDEAETPKRRGRK